MAINDPVVEPLKLTVGSYLCRILETWRAYWEAEGDKPEVEQFKVKLELVRIEASKDIKQQKEDEPLQQAVISMKYDSNKGKREFQQLCEVVSDVPALQLDMEPLEAQEHAGPWAGQFVRVAVTEGGEFNNNKWYRYGFSPVSEVEAQALKETLPPIDGLPF